MALEKCGNCSENLPKTGEFATCSGCSNGLHFDTCSIKRATWNNMGGSKQASWLCTSCRKSKKGSVTQYVDSGDESNLPNSQEDRSEVSSLDVQQAILSKVDSLMDMKVKLDSIESSMKFLADKYDALLTEVSSLREENKQLKSQLDDVKKQEVSSRNNIEKLSCEVAELDQYGRRLNMEIQGLEVKGDPKQEDMLQVMEQLAGDIKVKFNPSDVHQVHRLQPRKDGKPPTIIVQFYSKDKRDIWLNHGRKARLNNIYFNENLSTHYRLLLKEAKLRARTHNYNYVWFRGGRILARRNENDRNVVVIKNSCDLNKMK